MSNKTSNIEVSPNPMPSPIGIFIVNAFDAVVDAVGIIVDSNAYQNYG